MKKLILAAAAAVMLSSGGAMAQGVVKLGTEGAYPPFNFYNEKKELVGFDIEIGDALCAEMKRKCEWVANEWDTIIPALNAKKFDAIIAQMSIRPDRAEKVDFTKPYSSTPSKIIQPKGKGLKNTAESLKGKKVGVQRETIQEAWLKQHYTGVIEIVAYGTQDEANVDLGARTDAVMADGPVIDDFTSKEKDKYELVGEPIKMDSPGAAIAIRKGEAALLGEFNTALAAIIANGTYDKISKKYFDYSVKP
ncbi:transporter substrate-binding domain-containing protein [Lacibacterium aquatile]|uniref:Transporter substrate-binding domain-containing protein n=1 Tax=Lacibacterium aquatile TaxID=1168082 RepID=A0ABW5DUU2_9PROT